MMAINRLVVPVLLGIIRGLGYLPRSVGIWLGKVIGRLLYILDRKHRDIATDNLSRAFGWLPQSRQVQRIVQQVFNNLGTMLFEIAWANQLDPQDHKRYFRITGREHYQRAADKGRGVLLLTAHMGNWELFSIIAYMAAIPANVVYRPLDSRVFDEIIKQMRCRYGAELIPNKYAFYHIAKTLKNKACVAMLMDQNVDYYNGVYVDFFGRRACTNRGMAYMAMRTGAPVVPVFMLREEGGFRAKMFPEIPLIRTGDRHKDIELNTAKYNQTIETIIRQYPDQWFWVHQRWKTKAYCFWPREI